MFVHVYVCAHVQFAYILHLQLGWQSRSGHCLSFFEGSKQTWWAHKGCFRRGSGFPACQLSVFCVSTNASTRCSSSLPPHNASEIKLRDLIDSRANNIFGFCRSLQSRHIGCVRRGGIVAQVLGSLLRCIHVDLCPIDEPVKIRLKLQSGCWNVNTWVNIFSLVLYRRT